MEQVILVIDDSLTVRKLLEVGLRRAGLTPSCYPDGIQALAAFTNRRLPAPDLITVVQLHLHGQA